MTERKVNRLVSVLNPQENGGESIMLTTDLYDNGDGLPKGAYCTQEIELNCYGNSASIFIGSGSTITPETLREMANELEWFLIKNGAR